MLCLCLYKLCLSVHLRMHESAPCLCLNLTTFALMLVLLLSSFSRSVFYTDLTSYFSNLAGSKTKAASCGAKTVVYLDWYALETGQEKVMEVCITFSTSVYYIFD